MFESIIVLVRVGFSALFGRRRKEAPALVRSARQGPLGP
jgi:hypothetical protein